ncbi:unnamed protein product, partial [Amoebophrya sp. A120]
PAPPNPHGSQLLPATGVRTSTLLLHFPGVLLCFNILQNPSPPSTPDPAASLKNGNPASSSSTPHADFQNRILPIPCKTSSTTTTHYSPLQLVEISPRLVPQLLPYKFHTIQLCMTNYLHFIGFTSGALLAICGSCTKLPV